MSRLTPASGAAACRVTMPCWWRDTPLAGFAGAVRCRRRFGLPRQVDAHERLWLTFAGATGRATVTLNGQPLAGEVGPAPCAFEVTGLLLARNELAVVVEAGPDGGLWGEVALEVRCTAYLHGVRAWRAGGRLHAAGTVVGVADRLLDLYLLDRNRTAAYAAVEASPAGQPFELCGDLPAGPAMPADEPDGVRVELVNGGTVWYQWVPADPPGGE